MIQSRRWTFVTVVFSAAVIGFAAAGYVRTQNNADPGVSALRNTLGVSGANEVNRFTSLPEMTTRADAIVEGRVVRIEPGRVFAGPPPGYYVTAYVQVLRALKGASDSRELAVEFYVGDGSGSQEFMAALEGFRGLWFLLDKHAEARRLGLSGELVDREAGYYMLASSQGLVGEQSGQAVNVFGSREVETAPLIDATDGIPYEAVKTNVDDLAGTEP